jgi:DNA-binding winged helix-turn-helix (wHTH) protein/TolB-like protein/tetratricopeptide (TPR) repeat protein
MTETSNRALSRSVFEFGPFRLEPAEGRLTKDGAPVHVTPKALDLLVALATRPGRLVTKEELVAEVWPDTFVEEGNLAVNMTRLRQVLNDDTGQQYIETVPKRGYRFVAPVREIVAGQDAPAAAPPPESAIAAGPLPQSEPAAAPPGPPVTARPAVPANSMWPGAVASVLIVLAGAGAAYAWRTSHPPGAAGPVQSLVVTRFSSIAASAGQPHLEMGIPDALTTRLASLRQLRVPPTAVLRADEDPFATAARLGVDAVLTGSVQRDGDQLRVTAQLSRSADHAQLWAGRFDQKFTDVFAVEDALAERIASSLITNLSSTERASLRRRETPNAAAYDLYLKGRELWNRRTPESIRSAISLYQDAIALDGGFVLAQAGLADAYSITASGLPGLTRYPLARAAARRAVELDDRSADAHNALAFVTYKSEWKWAEAEREFKRAIELNPNFVLAHHWYGEMLGLIGRSDDARAEFRRAQELDPLSVAVRVDFARMLTRLGRARDALQLVDEGLAVNPAELRLYRERALALFAQGRNAEAVDNMLRYRTLAGTSADDLTLLRSAMASGGVRGYRLQEVEILRRQLKAGGAWPYGLATALALGYAGLSDRDQTIEWLQRCADTLEDGALGMKQGREYDFVRDDPRFRALYRRLGLP